VTAPTPPLDRRRRSTPVLRIRKKTRRLWLVLGAGLTGLGALACLVAAGLALLALTRYGPAVLAPWTSPWLFSSSSLLALGGAALLHTAWLETRYVSPTRRGLAHRLRVRSGFLAWEDVQAVYAGTVRYGFGRWTWGRRGLLRLVNRQGNRLTLPATLAGLDRVAAHAKARAYPALLADGRERFNRGEGLAFGPIRLDRSGLVLARRAVKWEELDSVTVDGGILRLTIRRTDRLRTYQFPVWKIPNFDLCLQILTHLGRHP